MKKKIVASVAILSLAFSAALPGVCFAKSALTYFETVVDLSEAPEPTREEYFKKIADSAKKQIEGKNNLSWEVYAETAEKEITATDVTQEAPVKVVKSLKSLLK